MSKQYTFSQELALYGGLSMLMCLGFVVLFFNRDAIMTNHIFTIIYDCMIYIPPCIFIIGIAVGISGSLRKELLKSNIYGLLFNITMLLLHSSLVALVRYKWVIFK